MKKYFITGGGGFIGHHLTKQLLKEEDNEVITYDAYKYFIKGNEKEYRENLRYRRDSVRGNKLTRLIGDCLDADFLKGMLHLYKPDVIIHLASLPIVKICNERPEEAKLNIFDSLFYVLKSIKEENLCEKIRFIYISSSMVYGHFLREPNGEIKAAIETQKCNPIGIYGALKLAGEYLVKVYNYEYNLQYTIIRPSAVYGETDCNKRVVEVFLKNAQNKKDIVLENAGNHKLDFTFIDDLVEGIIQASLSSRAINETFNLTGGDGRQIKELPEIIKKYTPNISIRNDVPALYSPYRGALNISKARNLLNYNPKYSLEAGIKKYIEQLKG